MSYAASPPPLQHPIPRAPFHPPEPPRTPSNASPATTDPAGSSSPYGHLQQQPSYERYSSPPPNLGGQGGFGAQQQQQPPQQMQQGYAGMQGGGYYAPSQPSHHHQPLGSMASSSTSSSAYPQQQQQQQRGWNPMASAMGAAGMNDATAQMGLQFGSHVLGAGQNYVEQTFTRHLPMPLLKHSFAVSNAYVLRKLGVLLWPWRQRTWARTVRRNAEGQGEGWASPREDINAPDLYIPTMSIITYILLSALHTGLQSRFHPEVLGLTASKALGVVLLEFMALKLGTYLLDVKGGGAGAWEVGFYGGYKFVGIICCLLVDLLSPGRLVWWSVFLYVVAANAFFLLRSLKYILLPDPAASHAFDASHASPVATVTHGQRTTRVRFLVCIAVGQVALMGALVWV